MMDALPIAALPVSGLGTGQNLLALPETRLLCIAVILIYIILCSQFRTLPSGSWLAPGDRRCDLISPVLRQLHWLPMWQHVVFKIATVVHQSLSSSALCQTTAFCRYFNLLSVGHAAVLKTGPLPPQDHKSRTVCRQISNYVGRHTASSCSF